MIEKTKVYGREVFRIVNGRILGRRIKGGRMVGREIVDMVSKVLHKCRRKVGQDQQ